MSHASDTTATVVVTYSPDDGLFARLDKIACQGGMLFVVDNGSGPETQDCLRARLKELGGELLANPENRGLAAALNQGIARAEQLGCEWVLTFDQDSHPSQGMMKALIATAKASPQPERVAVVGPRIVEERFPSQIQRFIQPMWWGFRRVSCDQQDLHGVMQLITSGALTNVRHWRALGGFNESLFIEYVDYEYCLRARLAGLELRVSAKALLIHNLGTRQERSFFGKKFLPTFHNPKRHYYMMRNRVWMWSHYVWKKPQWAIFDFFGSGKSLFTALILEPNRGAKIKYMWRGATDALFRRMGPMRE